MHGTRRIVALAVLACAAALAAVAAQNQAQKARPAGRTLGSPVTHLNLTLVPVIDARPAPKERYLTLDEAMKRKLIKVEETGGGGEVNHLQITNYGDHPIYIIAGEVVLGGQQDRCIGKDVIIGTKSNKRVRVPVYCVEHGRWSGATHFGAAAKTVAAAEVRLSAQEGAFAGKVAASPPGLGGSRAGRTTVDSVGAAQRQVWDTVARKSRALNATVPSNSYRGVLEQSAGDAQTRLAPYLKAFGASLGRDPNTVGVVALVDGKVTTADIFSSADLFRKLWPKLLRSYAADAAENPKPRVAKVDARALAQAFIAHPPERTHITVDRSQSGELQRLDMGVKMMYRTVPGGANGAAVHENILRK